MRLRTRILLISNFLLLLLVGSNVFSQTLPILSGIPELKVHLQTEMDRQHIAGMMLSIVTKDAILFAGGIGEANIEKHSPVTEKHLFRMASVTKTFTALAILKLVQDKKLSLDTPLRKIAPEIPFSNDWESTHPVTIAQLLEHTTGFSNKSPLEEYNYSDTDYTGLASVTVFEKYLTSKWRPGERHSYSNVNYAVLAYVVEKVSGMSFQEYVRTAVFLPLNMTASNVHLRADASDTYAQGYVWKGNHFQTVPHLPQYSAGNGSMHTNATDAAHVLQAYLNDWKTVGGQSFLSKEILNDAEKPHTYLSAKAGLLNTYAYGLEKHDYENGVFIGHSGSIGGYVSLFLYNRSLGIGYAISINTFNEHFLRYTNDLIQKFLSQQIVVPKPTNSTYPLNHTAIQEYEGYYRFSSPNQLYTGFLESWQHTFKLTPNKDDLSVRLLLGGQMTWKPADSTRLFFRNEYSHRPHIAFLKDADGKLVITDNNMYFRKISAVEAWLPLILFISSVLLMVSTFFTGLLWIVLFFLKKTRKDALLLRLLPMAGTTGLLIVVLSSMKFIEHQQECTPMQVTQFFWVAGKYLFGFCSLLLAGMIILRWKVLQSKWTKVYLGLVSLASIYILGLLITNHWFL